MKKTALIYFVVWLVLSVVYVFVISEPLTAYLFAGWHDVTTWLAVVSAGLIFIFLFMSIVLTIHLVRKNKK